jgi:hypothetical protein
MTDPAHDPKRGDPAHKASGTARTSDTDTEGRKGPARAAATLGPESDTPDIRTSSGAGVEAEQPFVDPAHAERPYTGPVRGERYGEEFADAEAAAEARAYEQARQYGEAQAYAEGRPYEERGRLRASLADLGSVPQLLRRLVDDTATLIRKELALATSEISKAVEDAKTGVVSMVAGGAVLYLGVIFLLASATLGLALFMRGWAAALIVGGVVTLVGVVMVIGGKNKMKPDLHRTGDSLRKDREMIERQKP